jgi:hypothetical protein
MEAATSNAEPNVELATAELDVSAVREAVLEAMQSGGPQMLLHALEEGDWSGDGSLVSVQLEMSDAMIELSYKREQEKLAAQAASRAAGRTVKVRLLGGAAVSTGKAKPRTQQASSAAASESIKTKASDEPVVRRMMEKFGAEIRIVMDRSER